MVYLYVVRKMDFLMCMVTNQQVVVEHGKTPFLNVVKTKRVFVLDMKIVDIDFFQHYMHTNRHTSWHCSISSATWPVVMRQCCINGNLCCD